MSFVTRLVEYASAIAAPPTMKTCARTPSPVSSSPRAWSACRIRALVNSRSGTVENLPGHKHAMAGEHGPGVGEGVRIERRAARDEPPRLQEAPGAVYPYRRSDPGLGGEELADPREGSVESRIAGWRRLLGDQCDSAGTRGSPEVVGESEQQPHRVALPVARQVFRDRGGELSERRGTPPHAWAREHLDVVLAAVEQPRERREIRSLGARLIRRDGRLRRASSRRELDLRDARGVSRGRRHF